MRGAALPAALAIAALALMLGFGSRRSAAQALFVAAVVALVASRVAVGEEWVETVFLSGWVGIVAVALLVYLPSATRPVKLVAAVIVGASAGLVVAAEGTPADLLAAMPAALLVVPASIAVARGYAVVPRVVASWLIAVALLAAVIPYAAIHPGYVPDHME